MIFCLFSFSMLIKCLGICAESFWIRADFLYESNGRNDIQSVKSDRSKCAQNLKPTSYPLRITASGNILASGNRCFGVFKL